MTPDENDNSHEANLRKATRITAQIPMIIADWDRIRKGKELVAPDQSLSHAANFLLMLNGEKPSATAEKTLDVALILHAEHELNASTFAARVIAATLADMHSAVTGAIGALKGPLHGGANEATMRCFSRSRRRAPIRSSMCKQQLADKKKIMGFGHRVYRTEDPRATHLRKMSEQLGQSSGNSRYFDMSRQIEIFMLEDKKINANVDFYSASTYTMLGLDIDLFTPIFAVSRIAGWAAHIIEQHDDNRLIRPRAEYIGPDYPTALCADGAALARARCLRGSRNGCPFYFRGKLSPHSACGPACRYRHACARSVAGSSPAGVQRTSFIWPFSFSGRRTTRASAG